MHRLWEVERREHGIRHRMEGEGYEKSTRRVRGIWLRAEKGVREEACEGK